MKKWIVVIVLLANAFILVSIFHSYHQEIHRVISGANSEMEIIAYMLAQGNTKHAIKLLDEWGVDYCACVAFSESMIKMVGNKRYMWARNAWHRIPKVDYMKYLMPNIQYSYESEKKPKL